MKTFIVLFFALCCLARGQIFYGTPSYQLFTNNNWNLILTNDTSNVWYLTSISGTCSNNIGMAGRFEFWHVRENYSNKVFMFEFADVTNFVWFPENKIRIGRNDRTIYKTTVTNNFFLLLGQER